MLRWYIIPHIAIHYTNKKPDATLKCGCILYMGSTKFYTTTKLQTMGVHYTQRSILFEALCDITKSHERYPQSLT